MSAALDFGSLNPALATADPYGNRQRSIAAQAIEDPEFRQTLGGDLGRWDFGGAEDAPREARPSGAINLMRSAGPISDAYILARNPMDLIIGPGGSGKTIATVKKMLVEAQRIRPGADGARRYVVGCWRQKYVNLWKATIPSYWKVLPRDLPGSKWEGSSPREAQHVVNFQDQWGPVQLIVRFRAFGESADPDDVLGNEFTDVALNEWPTMPEELTIALADRVGRDPPREVTGRVGRFYGDGNAPDVLSYIYRDFFETPKDGHVLHRQPGGLAPDAENIEAVGREYYENSCRINAHRPWWIRRMVHAQPGFTRANDPVYPKFDDVRNVSPATMLPSRHLPVLVGVDGGLTPAAVYMQEMPSGQLRIFAEVALERGGMKELSVEMLALEGARFPGFEFRTKCDPAMQAGEDTEESSDRSRLAKYLGRPVTAAKTNNPDTRWAAVRDKFDLSIEGGLPGLMLDPSCKGLRRGFNQTYAFRNIAGTNDRGNVEKTFDSHAHDALQYGALECGTAEARVLRQESDRERQKRKEKAANAPRYSPTRRWRQ